jgi:hypothetical protein
MLARGAEGWLNMNTTLFGFPTRSRTHGTIRVAACLVTGIAVTLVGCGPAPSNETDAASDAAQSTCDASLESDRTPQCNACLAANCCAETTACANSADCVARSQCDHACTASGGDIVACLNSCAAAHPEGSPLFQQVRDCGMSHCGDLCR